MPNILEVVQVRTTLKSSRDNNLPGQFSIKKIQIYNDLKTTFNLLHLLKFRCYNLVKKYIKKV